MSTLPPSILIVEDEALVATEIELILRRLGYRIAGKTRNGDEALDMLVNRKPDLALLDINIKGSYNGVDLARHIRKKHKMPFVFLTAYSDRRTLSEVQETLPYGYIVKPFNERDLLSTIEIALHKFSSEQTDGFPSQEQINQKLSTGLTQREYEVLRHLDKGFTYQQTSDKMDVSINTVKTYQKALFAKMNVSSRLECLRAARRLLGILMFLLFSLAGLSAQFLDNKELEAIIGRYRNSYHLPDTTLAHEQLDSIKEIAFANDDPVEIGVYHFFSGKLAVRRGDFPAARKCAETALTYLEDTEAYLYQSSAHLDLCRFISATGDYAAVFEHGKRAYDAAVLAESDFYQGQSLNGMAIAKRRMGNPEEAINYFRRAERMIEDPVRKLSPLTNIAVAFNQLGQVDSSLYYFEECLISARELGDQGRLQLATILTNAGQVYAKNGLAEKALRYAEESAEIFDEIGNPNQQLAARQTAANAYIALDKPERALPHLYSAKKLVDQGEHLGSKYQIYGTLLDAYSALSGSDSVSHYLATVIQLRDSINTKNRQELMTEMETRFDVQEKEAAIALSEISLKRQRWIIALAGLGLLILGSFLWFVIRQRRKISTQNEIIATSLAEKETLLKEIHHRVKNNLQMVSTLLSLQSNYIEDKKAQNALQLGRNRVRSMALIHQGLYLQDTVTPTIATDEYLSRLTAELLATYNNPNVKLDITTDFDPIKLDIDHLIPLGLIANELVTNAMKYAFEGRSTGKLSVSLKKVDDKLCVLRVVDDGPGTELLLKENTKSFGTLLINTLTEQLNGRLEVDASAGTDVRIIF